MANHGFPLSARIGEKHNLLTIRKYFSKREKNVLKYYFLCDCDCGKKNVEVRYENINKTYSCGCKSKKNGNISYISKQDSYLVRIKGRYIGIFTSLDIAEKVRNEACKNIDQLDDWLQNRRMDYIHSIIPDYNEKISSTNKGIQYKSKYKKFMVNFTKDKIPYFIGSFTSLDIAEKVRDEAYKNWDRIDTWMQEERVAYILSLVPDYKFHFKKGTKHSSKGISFSKKTQKYNVSVSKNQKRYHIGSFTSLDIAEKVRDEACKNQARIDTWMQEERVAYILSLVPDYKFRNK